MKIKIAYAITAAAAVLALFAIDRVLIAPVNPPYNQLARVQFEKFIVKHEKFYASPAKKEHKFAIFADNLKEILRVNSLGPSCWKIGLQKNLSSLLPKKSVGLLCHF